MTVPRPDWPMQSLGQGKCCPQVACADHTVAIMWALAKLYKCMYMENCACDCVWWCKLCRCLIRVQTFQWSFSLLTPVTDESSIFTTAKCHKSAQMWKMDVQMYTWFCLDSVNYAGTKSTLTVKANPFSQHLLPIRSSISRSRSWGQGHNKSLAANIYWVTLAGSWKIHHCNSTLVAGGIISAPRSICDSLNVGDTCITLTQIFCKEYLELLYMLSLG